MVRLQAFVSLGLIQRRGLFSKMPRAKTIEENLVRSDATKIRQVDPLLDRVEEGLQTT